MEVTMSTLDLFAATKQTEGKSPRTISWYRGFLVRFATFAGKGQDVRLKDISIDTVRGFIAWLQGQTTRFAGHPNHPEVEGGLSPNTIHGFVRTLKAFASWLYEEGFTSSNILSRLKRPKVPQPMIEILSDKEIGQVFASINPSCFLGARMYAIALLLLDTGIRATELCTLTMDNTFLDDGYVKVKGKGNKERIVPFGSATKKALIRYITTFRPEPTSSPTGDNRLVLSPQGDPLTYVGLSKAIKRLGITSSIPRLHAHLFRHTFAVNYLMNGGDVMTLKLILGHTTLDVTQVYMHLAEAHVKIQHDRFSPVDRLGIGSKRRKA
ncbi:MAG: tyrosine-type recombinase/integrase [Anaerolineae bacterium]